MTGDEDQPDATPRAHGPRAAGPHLQRVDGPLGPAEPVPPVRLCREWKGLTVADLLRDEIVERLPGKVRSALRHLERGDLAAADRALLGDGAPLLVGPGHRRRQRPLLVAFLVVAAVFAAALVASAFR